MIELDAVIQWLEVHQQWLALAIGLIAFLESLVLVGLVLPGVVMLFAAATLAGGGALDIWTLLFAGFAGALLGDGVSFFLGRKFHNKVSGWGPFRSHPEWLTQSEAFFEKHGGLSIALGRFIGPIRPVIPLVAGMMGMPVRYFLIVNLLSSLAWAPVYLLPGYFVGASSHWQEYVPLAWLLSSGLLLMAAVYVAYLAHLLLARFPWQKLYLSVLASLVLFTLIVSVFELFPQAKELNSALFQYAQSQQTPFLNKFFMAVTQMGGGKIQIVITALIAIWLVLDTLPLKRLGSLWLVGGFIGLVYGYRGTIDGLKILYAGPRPLSATEHTFSYPSGHSANSIFIGLWLGWYLARYLPDRYKPWLWSAGLFTGLLIIESRIYLAEHWLTDVMGGLGVGATFFMGWLLLEKRFPLPLYQENRYWRWGQFVAACTILVVWRLGLIGLNNAG